MKLNKDNRIPELEHIIRDAGAAIMEIYNQDERGISYKDDNSPLTRADRAAHQIIFDGISEMDVEYGFIGEENKNESYLERKIRQYNWMVDPLDGTKEFISRNGEFTVNIALLQDQRPVLGFVYIPVSNMLYWGAHQQGAWVMGPKDKTPKPLQASSFAWSDENLRVLCSRSHLNEKTETFLKHLNHPQQLAAGSALKFLRIAEGEADIYPRLAPTMEWDTAAAEIILIESGGTVYRWPELDQMKYNKKDLLNPYFVAFGTSQQNELLNKIRKEIEA